MKHSLQTMSFIISKIFYPQDHLFEIFLDKPDLLLKCEKIRADANHTYIKKECFFKVKFHLPHGRQKNKFIDDKTKKHLTKILIYV